MIYKLSLWSFSDDWNNPVGIWCVKAGMQRRLCVMSEAKWSITEAKCLQISHNKYASQRDAISPSMGDLMLSLSISCKIDTRRCLSWLLTLCQDCIIYLCFRGLICCLRRICCAWSSLLTWQCLQTIETHILEFLVLQLSILHIRYFHSSRDYHYLLCVVSCLYDIHNNLLYVSLFLYKYVFEWPLSLRRLKDNRNGYHLQPPYALKH